MEASAPLPRICGPAGDAMVRALSLLRGGGAAAAAAAAAARSPSAAARSPSAAAAAGCCVVLRALPAVETHLVLSQAGGHTVTDDVERLLSDDHLEVRTEALLYLTRHSNVDPLALIEQVGDYHDFSIQASMIALSVSVTPPPGGISPS
mgnify:CR=1 FL=1